VIDTCCNDDRATCEQITTSSSGGAFPCASGWVKKPRSTVPQGTYDYPSHARGPDGTPLAVASDHTCTTTPCDISSAAQHAACCKDERLGTCGNMFNGETGGPFPCTGNFTFPLTGSFVGGDRFAENWKYFATGNTDPPLPRLRLAYAAKPAVNNLTCSVTPLSRCGLLAVQLATDPAQYSKEVVETCCTEVAPTCASFEEDPCTGTFKFVNSMKMLDGVPLRGHPETIPISVTGTAAQAKARCCGYSDEWTCPEGSSDPARFGYIHTAMFANHSDFSGPCCTNCTAGPTDCASFVAMIKPGGCYHDCAKVLSVDQQEYQLPLYLACSSDAMIELEAHLPQVYPAPTPHPTPPTPPVINESPGLFRPTMTTTATAVAAATACASLFL
jgi:hypothetical protein